MQRCSKGIFSAFTLFFLFSASTASGSGFGIFTQGASALGQANAVVAGTEDPSTVFFNPALINKLPGTRIELGTTLIYPDRDFVSSATGNRHTAENELFFPSTFYLTHSFNEKLGFGFGFFTPFGLGTDWGETWEGRYIATKSEIRTYTLNPAISYRILPKISLAAGVSYLYLDATLEKKINPGFGLPDVHQTFSGDGHGYGYNLGFQADITDAISLGISYRSKIDVDADGDVSFGLPTPALAPVFPNTRGKSDLTLPQQLSAGVSYRPAERVRIEAGFRWEDWRAFEALRITLAQPVAGQTVVTEPKNWKDTYAFNVGVNYKLNDTVALLAGYLYSENAVPDATFEPSVPDADTHLFTIGTDLTFGGLKLAAGYGYQMLKDREKSNAVGGGAADGRYESELHLFGISLGYRF
jgi:long-chain fatty acid transport protein